MLGTDRHRKRRKRQIRHTQQTRKRQARNQKAQTEDTKREVENLLLRSLCQVNSRRNALVLFLNASLMHVSVPQVICNVLTNTENLEADSSAAIPYMTPTCLPMLSEREGV